MFVAEVVWTNNEYDPQKDKVVKRMKSNVKVYETEEDATAFVDRFYESCQNVETATFRIGKVYRITKEEVVA